ncbi:MAG: hypothetical protein V1751_00245 [Pseudomonadota bacterium]
MSPNEFRVLRVFEKADTAGKGLSALFEYLSRIRDELKQKIILLDERMEMTRLRLAKLRRMEGTLQE